MLMQDRCTACVERIIGSKIVLDAPDGTPRWRGSSGICFFPFGDSESVVQDRCMVCVERTIGSKIIFDTPNGTAT